MSWSPHVHAQPPRFESRVQMQEAYRGNPGAAIWTLQFSDGMRIHTAYYPARRDQRGSPEVPPVAILAGYTMDISYLHYMATQLSQMGVPVCLIQPPGQGTGRMRSGFRSGVDGYHHTIEGLATMYLGETARALHEWLGTPPILMGHSRGGYPLRVLRTGLRFQGYNREGRPLLTYEPENLAALQRDLHSIVALHSPLVPDPRLVQLAQTTPERVRRMRALEPQLREVQDQIAHLNAVGAAVAVALNPVHLLAGLLAGPSALFHAHNAYHISRAVSAEANRVGEWITQKRIADLLTGARELDSIDRTVIDAARRHLGAAVPSYAEIQREIANIRWIVGETDSGVLLHVIQNANPEGPTPAAEDEMNALASRGVDSAGGWITEGVSPQGEPYPILATSRTRAGEVRVPFFIIDAEGDGSSRDSRREVNITRGEEQGTVPGAHGGAVHSQRSIAATYELLRRFCAGALKR